VACTAAQPIRDGRPRGSRRAARPIAVVPAVELSAVDELGEDFHLLGYGIDHADELLARRLALWRADRAGRIERMAERLCGLGLAPDREELDANVADGRPVGRPISRPPRSPRIASVCTRVDRPSHRRSSSPTSSRAVPPPSLGC
jgi:hypothetical protein